MTSRQHYLATEAAIADPAYQSMQETNESLASIGNWSDRASEAYRNHFDVSPGKWNISNGLVAVGLAGVAISGLGEAALAADAVWQSVLLALDSLAAVFGLAGGSVQVIAGIAQLSQPELNFDFVNDLTADPFNLFVGVNYGTASGAAAPGDFGAAIEQAKWLSFFYSGISTKVSLSSSTSRLVNGGAAAGFFKTAAERWAAPAETSSRAPINQPPSQSANRDVFGAPEDYIFGDPQAADDLGGDRSLNIFGDNLPIAHGGGDPLSTPTPEPDPTPNPALDPPPEPIPDPGSTPDPGPDPGAGPVVIGPPP